MSGDVLRSVAFSKRGLMHCPLLPSPPSRASPVPACNGSGLSRARSNCTHNTRSKSLCRALRSVTCASRACSRVASVLPPLRPVQSSRPQICEARAPHRVPPQVLRVLRVQSQLKQLVAGACQGVARPPSVAHRDPWAFPCRRPHQLHSGCPAACLQGQEFRCVRRYARPRPA